MSAGNKTKKKEIRLARVQFKAPNTGTPVNLHIGIRHRVQNGLKTKPVNLKKRWSCYQQK